MINRHRDVLGINQELKEKILNQYKPSDVLQKPLEERMEQLKKKYEVTPENSLRVRKIKRVRVFGNQKRSLSNS